jgi:tetratricopeptide (TPR) repeat protein
LRSLIEAAATAGQHAAEGRAREALGIVLCIDLGEHRAAYECARAARDIFRATGDLWMTASTEQTLGLSAQFGGRLDTSITHIQQAIAIYNEFGDPWREGIARAAIAVTYANAGRPRDALRESQWALTLARRVGARGIESLALQELGEATLGVYQDSDRAIALCEEAVEVARAGGRRLQEGWALSRLAHVYLVAGRPELALPAVTEAVTALSEAPDPVHRAQLLLLYGKVLKVNGQSAAAEQASREGHDLCQRLNIPVPRRPPRTGANAGPVN